jgi:hypothetical protein
MLAENSTLVKQAACATGDILGALKRRILRTDQ